MVGVATVTDKQALCDALIRKLAEELSIAESAQKTTREGATHEEARPENDKDTRALELSYLARGQARRVEELRTALAEMRAMPLRSFGDGAPISVSAIVTLEDEQGERRVFVALHGGGERVGDGLVVVTTRSPLGRALLGKCEGDDVELERGGKRRELSILGVE